MRHQRTTTLYLLVLLLCFSWMPVQYLAEATTTGHVYSYITKMEISSTLKSDLTSHLKTAFEAGILNTDKALVALQLIQEQGGSQLENQQVFEILINTMDQGLPSNQLFNELTEGVARGVPMKKVKRTLEKWQSSMVLIKSLLDENGLRVGDSLSEIGRLTPEILYPLIEDLTGAIEQYILYGRDIEQGEVLKSRVLYVLRRDGRIPPNMVNVIQDRLEVSELTRTARELSEIV